MIASRKHSIHIVQWYPSDTGIFTSSSYAHGLHVWDTNRLKKVENFSFESPIHHHHMSPHSLQPLIAVASNKIYMVDLLVGSHVQSLPNSLGKNIDIVKWSNVEPGILTSVQDYTLLLWDVRQLKHQLGKIDIPNPQFKLNKSRPIAIQGLEFSPDGLRVALYLNDSSIYIYDIRHITKDPVILNPYKAPLVSLPQIPLGGRQWVSKFVYGADLISIPSLNQIKIVEVDTKKRDEPYTVPALHFGDITNVISNPKNPGCLYTASWDASIVEWSIYNKFDDNFT